MLILYTTYVSFMKGMADNIEDTFEWAYNRGEVDYFYQDAVNRIRDAYQYARDIQGIQGKELRDLGETKNSCIANIRNTYKSYIERYFCN